MPPTHNYDDTSRDDGPPMIFGGPVDEPIKSTASIAPPKTTSLTNDELAAQLLPVLRAAAMPMTVGDVQGALVDAAQSRIPLGRLATILESMANSTPPTATAVMIGDLGDPQRKHYMAAKVSPMSNAVTARAAIINAIADLSEVDDATPVVSKDQPGMTLAELTACLVATVDANVIESQVAGHVTALIIAGKLIKEGTGQGAIIDIAPGVLTAIVEAGALAVAQSTMPVVVKVVDDRSEIERRMTADLDTAREQNATIQRENDALRTWLRGFNISNGDIDTIVAPAKWVDNGKRGGESQPITAPGEERKTFMWSKRMPMDAELRAQLGDEYINADRGIGIEEAKLALAKKGLGETKAAHDTNIAKFKARKDEIDQARHDSSYLVERLAFKTADFVAGEEIICDNDTGEELERKPLVKPRVQGATPGLGGPVARFGDHGASDGGPTGQNVATGQRESATKRPMTAESTSVEVRGDYGDAAKGDQGRGNGPVNDGTEARIDPVVPKGKVKDKVTAPVGKVAAFLTPVLNMVKARVAVPLDTIAETFAEEARMVVSANVGLLIKAAAMAHVEAGTLTLGEGDMLRVAVATVNEGDEF